MIPLWVVEPETGFRREVVGVAEESRHGRKPSTEDRDSQAVVRIYVNVAMSAQRPVDSQLSWIA